MCGLLPSTGSAVHLPVLCIWKGYIYAVTARSHHFSDSPETLRVEPKIWLYLQGGEELPYNKEPEMMKINST